MKSFLNEIVCNFCIDGEFADAEPLKCGNINDTYILSFEEEPKREIKYILQRINHNVFKDPYGLMENVIAITQHIRKKVIQEGGNPDRETLRYVPTVDGEFVYKCTHGNYWRAYHYIDNAKTYQVVENPAHLYNAGKAFGKFQKYLSDFPVEKLHITIPDFHNTPKRYEAFLEAVENDRVNRVRYVQEEIRFVEQRASLVSILVDLQDNGQIPLRVTHNDTKFNNVLIDNQTGEGICVIDLDTVMPGTSLYDFGDSIRSGANIADEEEQDLSKVCMDKDLIEAFTRGFLEQAGDFLTPMELEYLPFSALLMAFELGIRFLTDYINGDVYFKILHENSNLDRARVQFKLVSEMYRVQPELCRIN